MQSNLFSQKHNVFGLSSTILEELSNRVKAKIISKLYKHLQMYKNAKNTDQIDCQQRQSWQREVHYPVYQNIVW